MDEKNLEPPLGQAELPLPEPLSIPLHLRLVSVASQLETFEALWMLHHHLQRLANVVLRLKVNLVHHIVQWRVAREEEWGQSHTFRKVMDWRRQEEESERLFVSGDD